jgi:predicted O-methyltransferase YrrM
MNGIAHSRPVLALKRAAWVAFHRWRLARRLLVIYRWPRFRDRAFDLAHLTFYHEEDASGPLQRDEALLLHALVRVMRPKVVVEFGFLGGHSAMNFLTALPPSSRVYSFDIDPACGTTARRFFGNRPNFRFICKSQTDITPADVDGGPIDFCFLDASHDLALNRATFERLLGLLAPEALVVVHDTGTWSRPHMEDVHRGFADARPDLWIDEGEYAHQPEERQFVNWVRETYPEFAQVHLHSRETVRHGTTVLQRSRALALPDALSSAGRVPEPLTAGRPPGG